MRPGAVEWRNRRDSPLRWKMGPPWASCRLPAAVEVVVPASRCSPIRIAGMRSAERNAVRTVTSGW